MEVDFHLAHFQRMKVRFTTLNLVIKKRNLFCKLHLILQSKVDKIMYYLPFCNMPFLREYDFHKTLVNVETKQIPMSCKFIHQICPLKMLHWRQFTE